MQVQPMTGHVHTHAELEQEGVGWVQQGQVDQQTHGGAAVCQHVQHGSKLGGWKRNDNQYHDLILTWLSHSIYTSSAP